MDNKPENQVPQGWRDVNVTLDMPIGAFLSFINALNQRLAAIEDVTQVPYGSKMISLTELYAIQAAEAQRQAADREEAAADKVEEVADNPVDQPGA